MYGSNTFIDRSRSSAEFALSVALDPKHVAALQRLEQGALDDSFFRVVPDCAVRQILIRIIKKRKKKSWKKLGMGMRRDGGRGLERNAMPPAHAQPSFAKVPQKPSLGHPNMIPK